MPILGICDPLADASDPKTIADTAHSAPASSSRTETRVMTLPSEFEVERELISVDSRSEYALISRFAIKHHLDDRTEQGHPSGCARA